METSADFRTGVIAEAIEQPQHQFPRFASDERGQLLRRSLVFGLSMALH